MEQQIRYCKTSDGVDIAYTTHGEGPPLVISPNILVPHLQMELNYPRNRGFYERLSRRLQVVRYDRRGADLLIHDAQYTDEEYRTKVGWGHSSITQALQFAMVCRVRRFVAFHHDPDHSDDTLDRLSADIAKQELPFEFTSGWEGETFELR